MDTWSENDHEDVLDLMGRAGVLEGILMPDIHVGSRYVHPDERTCSHCVRHDDCGWSNANNDGLPTHFGYRSGWSESRFISHMKGVIGQVCGNFQHSNRDINARHIQAERRRREENGEGNDWDTEEN